MKNFLVYILLSIIFFSCKRESPNAEEIMMDKSDVSEMIADDKKRPLFDTKNEEIKLVLQQKLQEYYDLIALQRKNPEFSDEIEKMLKKISIEKLKVDTSYKNTVIKDVTLIGELEQQLDSIKKIRFSYTANNQTNSLTAYITTTPVVFENKTTWNTQIRLNKK